MRAPYVKSIHRSKYDQQMARMLETIRLIVEYGGAVERWKSLIASVKSADMVFKLVELINAPQSTPALEFVSLRWKDRSFPLLGDELDASEDAKREGKLGESHSLSYGSKRPQLRHVELNGIPSGFIFDRTSPMVTNLTSLTLIARQILLPVQGISALLTASPRLESLCLGVGDVISSEPVSTFTASSTSLQVQLPYLRSFVLNTVTVHSWGAQLLQIIDAPSVDYFELKTGVLHSEDDPDPLPLFQYLCAGRLDGVLQCTTALDIKSPNCGGIFPVLRHLNIRHLIIYPLDLRRSVYSIICQAFTTTTHITLDLQWLGMLNEEPERLPNLTDITYRGSVCAEFFDAINSIAIRRIKSGPRIESVNLREYDVHHPTGELQTAQENGPGDIVDQFMAILRQAVSKVKFDPFEGEYLSDGDDGSSHHGSDEEVVED